MIVGCVSCSHSVTPFSSDKGMFYTTSLKGSICFSFFGIAQLNCAHYKDIKNIAAFGNFRHKSLLILAK